MKFEDEYRKNLQKYYDKKAKNARKNEERDNKIMDEINKSSERINKICKEKNDTSTDER